MAIEIDTFLKNMIDRSASDIYLTTGAPTCARIHGVVEPLQNHKFHPGEVHKIALSILNDRQKEQFEEKPEVNLAISRQGIGRFRVNIFQQRNETAMVIRHIVGDIPSLDLLGVPEILKKIVMEKRGLFLVVGATGTGKSTTVASLLEHRIKHHKGHIVTIEDPIEFTHNHDMSIVNQREVGVDTESYDVALKNALRQSPDVIYIGEIRSQESMKHAIAYAQTGHLCISTLHANNSSQAIDRIVNFFPKDQRERILFDLSRDVRAIVSQRLIPTGEQSRVAAFEVMLGTPLILDLIKRNNLGKIKEVMEQSNSSGMQTFDQALYELQQKDLIDTESALKNADSANNLRLKISLNEKKESTQKIGKNSPDRSGWKIDDAH